MQFTYDSYCSLLSLIENCGYEFADFENWREKSHCVILRHDIDYDISKALQMAEIEQERNIKSTYYILVTSDFYNIYSKENREKISQIIRCGHDIGLHFDEAAYFEEDLRGGGIYEKIFYESQILENVIGKPVKSVSMHRPSKKILTDNLNIPRMINTYGKTFFEEFKYISDSRRNWREPVEEIVASGKYSRMQILTHAFWYHEKEKGLHDTIKVFINSAIRQRWDNLAENFTDLESVIGLNEICSNIKVEDILTYLEQCGFDVQYEGDKDISIESFCQLDSLKSNCITWIKNALKDNIYDFSHFTNGIIVADKKVSYEGDNIGFIITKEPKAVFFTILNYFFVEKHSVPEYKTGMNTVIGENVIIGKNVSIGNNCTIVGEIQIGDNTIISDNVVIRNRVVIGKNCEIQALCAIGEDGFGYFEIENNKKVMIRHHGGVCIEDDVFIGAGVCIARGTIGNTIIETGSRIDATVFIAHNNHIEKNATIISSQLYGSVHIGENAYVVGSIVRNQCSIGENTMVGMGSVVTKDIEANKVAIGIPAKVIRER